MSINLVKPIVFAEGASTLVSVGTVMALGRCQNALTPVRNFVARRFIYPMLADRPAPGTERKEPAENDPLFIKACDKAALLVKGGIMVGAGFASHIPIQLALEGHCDKSSFRHVIVGKSAGIGVALGSIFMITHLAPSVMHSVHHVVCPVLSHWLPQGHDHARGTSHEICNLMTLEIPSSIISGLVNYGITRRGMH